MILIVLAGLDAYYLRLERIFRCLYEYVDRDGANDASPLTMNAAPLRRERQCWWWRAVGSVSVAGLYVPPALASTAVALCIGAG